MQSFSSHFSCSGELHQPYWLDYLTQRVFITIPESQTHRMIEAERDHRAHLVQPFCSSRVTHSTLLQTMSRWLLKETPQSLWAVCSNAQSPSQWRSSSSYSGETSCGSIYAHCLFCHCLAPLKNPLDTLSSDTCTHWSDPTWPTLLWAEQPQLP